MRRSIIWVFRLTWMQLVGPLRYQSASSYVYLLYPSLSMTRSGCVLSLVRERCTLLYPAIQTDTPEEPLRRGIIYKRYTTTASKERISSSWTPHHQLLHPHLLLPAATKILVLEQPKISRCQMHPQCPSGGRSRRHRPADPAGNVPEARRQMPSPISQRKNWLMCSI